MKTRPILFNAPMVRALLAGTKTQTRRALRIQFSADAEPAEISATNERGHQISGHSGIWWDDTEGNPERAIRCPYGLVGDQLWVRESWMPDPPCDGTWAYTAWAGERIGQIAAVPERFRHPKFCNYAAQWGDDKMLWTPSIHMPRWASRITLEITGVRVERLQDISASDALAEGVNVHVDHQSKPPTSIYSPVQAYRDLWESINGPGSWDANPWVWVVEFRRLP